MPTPTTATPAHVAVDSSSAVDKDVNNRNKKELSTHQEQMKDHCDGKHKLIVIILSAQEKLGVKLITPIDGVVKHGLMIDSVDNPSLTNDVQAGDLIITIGGKSVDQMKFVDAVALIRDLLRPIEIVFQINEARRTEIQRQKHSIMKANDLSKQLPTYTVVFDDMPMGLKLEEAPKRFGIDGAVVCELTGQAMACGKIKVGDILSKVNDTDVLCRPYTEVMNVLRDVCSSEKTLCFIPKDQLPDVQRISSLRTGSFLIRKEALADMKRRFRKQVTRSHSDEKHDDEDDDDSNKAIQQLAVENLSARHGGNRLSLLNYEGYSTPILHLRVISATNLANDGSTVNAMCEVTVGKETFKTSVVTGQRSPVWKQDNSASFEVPNEDMMVEIRVFDEHFFRSSELIAALIFPLKSLPNMQKCTKNFPLALGGPSAGAFLTLTLEYVNRANAYQDAEDTAQMDTELGPPGIVDERDELIQIQTAAQIAAEEAAQSRALLEQAREQAEAVLAAAREEQERGKAAVEAALAQAAQAKQEAERQAAEARRAQLEAERLIADNWHIQQEMKRLVERLRPYHRMVLDGRTRHEAKLKMQQDGIDELSIVAFFDDMDARDETIPMLQRKRGTVKLIW